MLIKEFRVVLPMSVEEYQVAQLWSVAEMSKNETGGGEGVEVMKNEPFGPDKNVPMPTIPLLDGRSQFQNGQYTLKWYHLQSKVPKLVRYLAPKGSLDVLEEAWNAFPYCRTIISNPGYMKQDFEIKIETYHLPDAGTTENAHQLPPDLLAKREVILIDIANDPVAQQDYKAEWDPSKYHSDKTGRGPLVGPDWRFRSQPVMTCYKLVTCNFKWFGLQSRVEQLIQRSERRLFTNFHRQLFCSTDSWYGLTMADIRRIEDETKKELEVLRTTRGVVGTNPDVDGDA